MWNVWQIVKNEEHFIATFNTAEEANNMADYLEEEGWSGINVSFDDGTVKIDKSFDEDMCFHQKVYDNKQLMSNPPQQRWICKSCGEEGVDVVGKIEWNQYDELRKKFGKDE